jgi:hypothetical protein
VSVDGPPRPATKITRMSSIDRLVLWLHVAFVIFTIGPVTIAIMSSPRAIRTRNIGVLRYLALMTRVFGAASLGVLIFGIVLGQSLKDLSKAWLTVSLTLFVVALVLLVLIMRDQRRAIAALESMARQPAAPAPPSVPDDEPSSDRSGQEGEETASSPERAPAATAVAQAHVASVERGRIASLGGVVSLIWLTILVLMVWNS